MSDASAAPSLLVEVHAQVHAAAREHIWSLVEDLVRLDVDGARAHHRRFAEHIAAHVALEDTLVLPRYASIAPSSGPAALRVVEGDHALLQRGIDDVAQLLGALPAGVDLRTVLVELPRVYRLGGVFDHHGERELNVVYPAVATLLDDDDAARLLAGLRALHHAARA